MAPLIEGHPSVQAAPPQGGAAFGRHRTIACGSPSDRRIFFGPTRTTPGWCVGAGRSCPPCPGAWGSRPSASIELLARPTRWIMFVWERGASDLRQSLSLPWRPGFSTSSRSNPSPPLLLRLGLSQHHCCCRLRCRCRKHPKNSLKSRVALAWLQGHLVLRSPPRQMSHKWAGSGATWR